MSDGNLLNSSINIFESFHNFIIVDKNGIVVFFSKSYARFLGKDRDEVIGRHVADVIQGTRLPEVLETGIEEVGKIMTLKNAETNCTVSAICNRLPIRKDGEENGEIIGAMGEAVICDFADVFRLYEEVETLRLQNEEYRSQIAELHEAKLSISNILGDSVTIQELKSIIRKVANSSISITVTGETGTGKELVANAVHQLSRRSKQPFIKINCAAIPKDLLESELFGYEPGAFTGANKQGRIGKFEMAHKGTILLDEIGEMPLELQSKLLRVLQEKEIDRIGGAKPIPIDVRIICSTNRDLAELVSQGNFREDLYYRINVMEIPVPPLRDHFEDLPILCRYFIDECNQDNGLNIFGINEDVYDFFQAYHWPGNIRELIHALERACVMLGSGELRVEHFDFLLRRMIAKEKNDETQGVSLRDHKEHSEREEIIKALAETHGNKSATAKLLKIDRSLLYNKLKKYQIPL